jgi:hypothetical protein
MTYDEAHRLFEYRDGALYWKVTSNSRALAGAKAGTFNSHLGRFYVRANKKSYLRSRLIFLMHHGEIPDEIDHVDGVRDNDRIENLRAATAGENQRNKRRPLNNTSGFKNIRFRAKKWTVELKINNKNHYFGRYDDLELAELVAVEARNKYHGAFANHV